MEINPYHVIGIYIVVVVGVVDKWRKASCGITQPGMWGQARCGIPPMGVQEMFFLHRIEGEKR
jgi:hypothetical protein